MDFTDWYAVVLGGLLTYALSVQFLVWISKRRHLCCRQIRRCISGTKRISWLRLFLLVLFLIGNVLSLSLHVNDISGFVTRSGIISVINLVPLLLGGRINLVADRCGIGLETLGWMHRWLGRIAILEGLIHTAVGFSTRKLDLHTVPDVAALIAASTLLVILLSGPLGRYAYEAFVWLHVMFALSAIIFIYLHLSSKGLLKTPTVYLLSAVCLLVVVGAMQFAYILYRNVRYGKPLSAASVRLVTFKRKYQDDILVPGVVHVHVRLSTPWALRAGQYAYLCIPGVSRTSFAQLHPFYVAWGYKDESGHDCVVFIIQKEKGFTKSLFSHSGTDFDNGSERKAIVDGPYGKELSLGLFGTVLLFATGIGIAAQLPYVAQLLAEHQHNETNRIVLCWQVEGEIQTAWVADQMQMLLEQDINRILDIRLFVTEEFLSTKTRRGDHVQLGERIDMAYDAMDTRELIASEINGRKGRVVICTCVDDDISSQIHKAVWQQFEHAIEIKELDFRPNNAKGQNRLLATAAKLCQRALRV